MYLEQDEWIEKAKEKRDTDPDAAIAMIKESGMDTAAVDVYLNAESLQHKAAAFNEVQSMRDDVQAESAGLSMQMPFGNAASGEEQVVAENGNVLENAKSAPENSAFMPFGNG